MKMERPASGCRSLNMVRIEKSKWGQSSSCFLILLYCNLIKRSRAVICSTNIFHCIQRDTLIIIEDDEFIFASYKFVFD